MSEAKTNQITKILMTQIIEQNGKKYLILGDKAIPYEFTDKHGKPMIEVKTEETKNKNGGMDIKVYVQTLKVVGTPQFIDNKKIIN